MGTCFGEPEETHLTLADQLSHRAHRLFDRHVRIDPVQVVQVDDIDTEAAEAGFARRPHTLGSRVHLGCRAARAENEAEFAGQDDLTASFSDRTADERLVGASPVCIGGIDQRDAQIEGPMNRTDRFLIVRSAVALGHSHTSQTDSRDGQAARAEFTLFHICNIQG